MPRQHQNFVTDNIVSCTQVPGGIVQCRNFRFVNLACITPESSFIFASRVRKLCDAREIKTYSESISLSCDSCLPCVVGLGEEVIIFLLTSCGTTPMSYVQSWIDQFPHSTPALHEKGWPRQAAHALSPCPNFGNFGICNVNDQVPDLDYTPSRENHFMRW